MWVVLSVASLAKIDNLEVRHDWYRRALIAVDFADALLSALGALPAFAYLNEAVHSTQGVAVVTLAGDFREWTRSKGCGQGRVTDGAADSGRWAIERYISSTNGSITVKQIVHQRLPL